MDRHRASSMMATVGASPMTEPRIVNKKSAISSRCCSEMLLVAQPIDACKGFQNRAGVSGRPETDLRSRDATNLIYRVLVSRRGSSSSSAELRSLSHETLNYLAPRRARGRVATEARGLLAQLQQHSHAVHRKYVVEQLGLAYAAGPRTNTIPCPLPETRS